MACPLSSPCAACVIVSIVRSCVGARFWLWSLSGRRVACRECGRWRALETSALLFLGDPVVELRLADDVDRDRHEGVVLAAQLGALAVKQALACCLEPGVVETAGNRVDLDA